MRIRRKRASGWQANSTSKSGQRRNKRRGAARHKADTQIVDWLKSLTIAEFAQSGERPAKWQWRPGEDFPPQLSELSFQAAIQSGARVLVGERPVKKR